MAVGDGQWTWRREFGGGPPAGTKVEGDERRRGDAGGDHEHGRAETVNGRGLERLAGWPFGAGVGDEDEEREADRGADRGARRHETGSDALLAVRHPGRGRNEHGGESDAVTNAERYQPWHEREVGAVLGHSKAKCGCAQTADDERGDQGAPDSEAGRQWTRDRGAGDHDCRREEKRESRLEWVVAVHVLEVEREEVEHRAEGGPEQEADHDRGREVAVGEEPRWYEWLRAAPLDHGERGKQEQAGGRARHDGGRPPAEAGTLDECDHEQRHTERGAQRSGQVEPAPLFARRVGGY